MSHFYSPSGALCSVPYRRHVDWRLLPLLGALYALSLIDRTNIGVAFVTSMTADLRLDVGARYNIVSCIYFVPYILLELPSNMCLRAIGARNLLSGSVIAWGAVQLAMGFVPTWGYLLLCRTLLGVFEAGFFPALVFIVTTWYKRHEVQKKLAALYMTSILAGGFSAILAYALSLLDGKGGLSGWAWIFIVEGAATMAFGIASWIFIPDFPDKNTFLTAKQTALVLRRIEEDRGDSVPDSLRGKVLLHLSDWKIWIFATMYLCVTVPAYAIGFFASEILNGMGWNAEMSMLLTAPPYAVSVISFAWLSDRYRMRALFIAIQALMTLIGLALIGYVDMSGWRYTGIFLANAGCSASIPGILAYTSNNIVSQSKRAVATATTVSFGGIGGIIATTIYRDQDLPRYLPGIIATISLQILLLILLGIMTVYFWYENKKVKLQKDGQVGGFLYVL
ncbi:major facilitator superfamily domain-containing protein [Desarmillaria tabescens]|uniref:Major facilitator superfamily domain-containing protein n=1 Tax=Armillaria tabescens TaxID=1929756 RepID=A0AA39MYA1_ARMTA|nr:major facilitator superfamily domain-containing protein [Desarmillaria tabescens]KAK0451142.1 major facilitator superfamily domain-containing protein [Desarmillaria tabescens]